MASPAGSAVDLPPPVALDTEIVDTGIVAGKPVVQLKQGDSCGTQAFKWIATALAIAGFVVGAGTLLVHLGLAQVAWTSAGALSSGMSLNIAVISLGVAVIATILRIVELTLSKDDEKGSAGGGDKAAVEVATSSSQSSETAGSSLHALSADGEAAGDGSDST